MKRALARPRRRLRHELLSLLPVAALFVALGLLFPYTAVGFRTFVPMRMTAPSCRFVDLSDEAEGRALDLVRSVFSVKPEIVQSLREDLLLSPLPERESTAILSVSDRLDQAPAVPLAHDVLPFPPSLAAPDLADVEEDSPSSPEKPAFSREELLELEL